MPKFLNLSRKTILVVSILALSLALSSTSAFATAHYRVWYFDDIFDTFQEGDISDGWTKLIPPAWACGLRFNDPIDYRWVGDGASTIASGDFFKDVNVWIPKPGCPESDPFIEYKDGSATFPHQLGAGYMEIRTNYAVHWFDEDGLVPWCGACTSVGDFMYSSPSDGGLLRGSIATLKTLLLMPRQQLLVPDSVAALEVEVALLQNRLSKQIEARRRYDLDDREESVRSLENNATSRLTDAQEELATCQEAARSSLFCDAFVACDLGSESIGAAESLLTTAQYFFQE